MRYEILYKGAFPIVECHLERGEAIKAESDAMVAMSPTCAVEGKTEGGLLGGLMRRAFTGESFFLQRMVAKNGPGKVLFAHAQPGDIEALDLDGSVSLIVEKGGFLACTEGIEVNTKVQGLMQGLMSGEGFVLAKLTGTGTCFISTYGSIHTISLDPGEEFIIDNGHLVAWTDDCTYKMEKAAGFIDSLTSGEGMVCRFKGGNSGSSVVFIQTRNPESFKEWINSMVPAKD